MCFAFCAPLLGVWQYFTVVCSHCERAGDAWIKVILLAIVVLRCAFTTHWVASANSVPRCCTQIFLGFDGKISKLDVSTMTIIDFIPTGQHPRY